jgi:hypothetical protein
MLLIMLFLLNLSLNASDKILNVTVNTNQEQIPADLKNAFPHLIKAMQGLDTAFNKQLSSGFFKGITKEELIAATNIDKNDLYNPYTVVTKDKNNKLFVTPYNVFYKAELANVINQLEAAEAKIKNKEFKQYIKTVIEGLKNNKYLEMEEAWVKLPSYSVEFTLAPFEVYDDTLLGVKTAFESRLVLTNEKLQQQFKKIEANIKNLSAIFPNSDLNKSETRLAPIIIGDQIYATARGNGDFCAMAFNLPNTAEVRDKFGWKQIMLHNIMKTKFDTMVVPVAESVFTKNSFKLDFDSFFDFVVFHEISHSLGPQKTKKMQSINEALGDLYSQIEETKADIGSIYLLSHKQGKFSIPEHNIKSLYYTTISDIFRALKFGQKEAHGQASLIIIQWLKQEGALTKNGKTFSINLKKMNAAVKSLLVKLTKLQLNGNYNDAKKFSIKYTTLTDDIKSTLNELKNIPDDLKVTYTISN